jgi:long-chain-alcohol oxidase
MLLLRVVLWILSTKMGTFVLCGWLCVTGRFPYVCKFADMPLERREEVLKRWNKARWLFPLKATFVLVKILSHFAFYTVVRIYVQLQLFARI